MCSCSITVASYPGSPSPYYIHVEYSRACVNKESLERESLGTRLVLMYMYAYVKRRGEERERGVRREKERARRQLVLTPSLCPFLLPPSLTTTVQSLGRWPTLLHFQQT